MRKTLGIDSKPAIRDGYSFFGLEIWANDTFRKFVQDIIPHRYSTLLLSKSYFCRNIFYTTYVPLPCSLYTLANRIYCQAGSITKFKTFLGNSHAAMLVENLSHIWRLLWRIRIHVFVISMEGWFDNSGTSKREIVRCKSGKSINDVTA